MKGKGKVPGDKDAVAAGGKEIHDNSPIILASDQPTPRKRSRLYFLELFRPSFA